jgi:excisionase family DNA binding protein
MEQKKYYTVEEAARILGTTSADVGQRRERNELRGYRDGASWKFPVEEVDALARQLRAGKRPAAADGGSGVLSRTAEPGGSSASGTVVGPRGATPPPEDVELGDRESDTGTIARPASAIKAEDAAAIGSMDLSIEGEPLLDEKVSLDDDSSGTVAGMMTGAAVPAGADDSSVSLANGGKKLDDDDVVLGGSGSGSDITLGGDSGVSLLDPSDSGLSLEEPLELDRVSDESLELGEDDMLTFADDTGSTAAPAGVKKDQDFLLTPLEEAPEEEDSASGSQVIALDSPVGSDDTATMVAAPAHGGVGAPSGMAAMLDEEFVAPGGPALRAAPVGAPLGPAQPMFAAAEAPMAAPAGPMALPEAPYSGLNIAALMFCVLLLILCGVLALDLLRNMWSWNGSYSLSSWIMDTILGRGR